MSTPFALQRPRTPARSVCAVAVPARTTAAAIPRRTRIRRIGCNVQLRTADFQASPAGGRVRDDAAGGQRSLCCSEPCKRHAVGRATDVVEAQLVAESHRLRLSPVLPADAELELGFR